MYPTHRVSFYRVRGSRQYIQGSPAGICEPMIPRDHLSWALSHAGQTEDGPACTAQTRNRMWGVLARLRFCLLLFPLVYSPFKFWGPPRADAFPRALAVLNHRARAATAQVFQNHQVFVVNVW